MEELTRNSRLNHLNSRRGESSSFRAPPPLPPPPPPPPIPSSNQLSPPLTPHPSIPSTPTSIASPPLSTISFSSNSSNNHDHDPMISSLQSLRSNQPSLRISIPDSAFVSTSPSIATTSGAAPLGTGATPLLSQSQPQTWNPNPNPNSTISNRPDRVFPAPQSYQGNSSTNTLPTNNDFRSPLPFSPSSSEILNSEPSSLMFSPTTGLTPQNIISSTIRTPVAHGMEISQTFSILPEVGVLRLQGAEEGGGGEEEDAVGRRRRRRGSIVPDKDTFRNMVQQARLGRRVHQANPHRSSRSGNVGMSRRKGGSEDGSAASVSVACGSRSSTSTSTSVITSAATSRSQSRAGSSVAASSRRTSFASFQGRGRRLGERSPIEASSSSFPPINNSETGGLFKLPLELLQRILLFLLYSSPEVPSALFQALLTTTSNDPTFNSTGLLGHPSDIHLEVQTIHSPTTPTTVKKIPERPKSDVGSNTESRFPQFPSLILPVLLTCRALYRVGLPLLWRNIDLGSLSSNAEGRKLPLSSSLSPLAQGRHTGLERLSNGLLRSRLSLDKRIGIPVKTVGCGHFIKELKVVAPDWDLDFRHVAMHVQHPVERHISLLTPIFSSPEEAATATGGSMIPNLNTLIVNFRYMPGMLYLTRTTRWLEQFCEVLAPFRNKTGFSSPEVRSSLSSSSSIASSSSSLSAITSVSGGRSGSMGSTETERRRKEGSFMPSLKRLIVEEADPNHREVSRYDLGTIQTWIGDWAVSGVEELTIHECIMDWGVPPFTRVFLPPELHASMVRARQSTILFNDDDEPVSPSPSPFSPYASYSSTLKLPVPTIPTITSLCLSNIYFSISARDLPYPTASGPLHSPITPSPSSSSSRAASFSSPSLSEISASLYGPCSNSVAPLLIFLSPSLETLTLDSAFCSNNSEDMVARGVEDWWIVIPLPPPALATVPAHDFELRRGNDPRPRLQRLKKLTLVDKISAVSGINEGNTTPVANTGNGRNELLGMEQEAQSTLRLKTGLVEMFARADSLEQLCCTVDVKGVGIIQSSTVNLDPAVDSPSSLTCSKLGPAVPFLERVLNMTSRHHQGGKIHRDYWAYARGEDSRPPRTPSGINPAPFDEGFPNLLSPLSPWASTPFDLFPPLESSYREPIWPQLELFQFHLKGTDAWHSRSTEEVRTALGEIEVHIAQRGGEVKFEY